MSGHSHWSGIKRKKEISDKKRGQSFSKLLNAIAIAARVEPNPEFNPRLRTAVDKAKENQVPQESIERSIKKAKEGNLEELLIEAYGSGGCAILIEAISNSRNRTMGDLKNIFAENSAKIANPGSVLWAFEKTSEGWQTKFPQPIQETDLEKVKKLIEELENHDDVQNVYANI
ncbi:MAG: YebC/PmpR family DNA-binding transcriptional regulator [Candidatus Paceibacterota bacterium]|jgi:YebC/PmpR family DNA-binding regulatory protein